jgi:peptidoglycan hydrolase-like protein with peptidoglycan-binding domain
VTSSQTDRARGERYRDSLARSRSRRERARRARRRLIRRRGLGVSLAAVSLTLAVAGAGVAIGQSNGTAASASGLLTSGSSGNTVAAVQRALGMPADAIDGVYGPRTQANVRLFQQRHGLVVDGIVGPQTLGALGLAGAPAPSGTQAAPQTAAPQQTSGQSAPQQTSGQSAPSSTLSQIAQCESGGNPQAVSPGGDYRGKYQFTYETWRAVGGSGDPAAAPEAEQDQRAATLYAQEGSSPWPVCGGG